MQSHDFSGVLDASSASSIHSLFMPIAYTSTYLRHPETVFFGLELRPATSRVSCFLQLRHSKTPWQVGTGRTQVSSFAADLETSCSCCRRKELCIATTSSTNPSPAGAACTTSSHGTTGCTAPGCAGGCGGGAAGAGAGNACGGTANVAQWP